MTLPQSPPRRQPRPRQEAKQALQQLTPTQHRQLVASAHRRFVPTLVRLGWQPEDLLQEAICRTLSGSRRWKVGISLMCHLRMCMKSLASNLLKPAKQWPLLACELSSPDSPSGQRNILEELARVTEPNEPERALQQLLALGDLLRQQGAHRTLAVLALLIRGQSSRRIRRRLQLTPSAYAYQRRLLRRHARDARLDGNALASLEKKSSRKLAVA